MKPSLNFTFCTGVGPEWQQASDKRDVYLTLKTVWMKVYKILK